MESVFEIPFEGERLNAWRIGAAAAPPVLYVHGATFPSRLAVGYRFDGLSWADDLVARGFQVWGFDFLGYGRSSRPAGDGGPVGRGDGAARQIGAVLDVMRAAGARPDIRLIAHSCGCVPAQIVAARGRVHRLALFGPIVCRDGQVMPQPREPWRLVTAADQHRRFVEDVPAGAAPVLSERHFAQWAADYLASDPDAAERNPPAVRVPSGPAADIMTLWSGTALYDPGAVRCPTLIVRGEWDSLTTDEDAGRLHRGLGAAAKWDVKIARATHLAHLEAARFELYAAVAAFLELPGGM